ncbi:hypothetical protein ebA4605 [Aromatoleum aromaticum EbN1]|uniref:Uncharacterized protein n=1 Tax=Aromatoleum aromaticum (strain DSM 19018 / LMG 30748 / EbN1) TaxID=76114 RepID=Q5P1T0_AROAE|nr:hypothetical protein ebA4605 [Aromatoleum aromaticum EbN1]
MIAFVSGINTIQIRGLTSLHLSGASRVPTGAGRRFPAPRKHRMAGSRAYPLLAIRTGVSSAFNGQRLISTKLTNIILRR